MIDDPNAPSLVRTPNKLTLAFLKCDLLEAENIEKHGAYEDVINNLFKPLLPDHVELEIHTFDVMDKRHYPTDQQLSTVDALIISGSFEDSAQSDCPWVLRLAGFLIKVADDFPRIRIIGICFGLQVIARAFGRANIVKSSAGWEVGSTRIDLTDAGRQLIWGDAESLKTGNVDGLKDHVMMQQIHSDIVPKVPEGFTLLGSSEKAPVQAIMKTYPKEKPPPGFTHCDLKELPDNPWTRVHILAFQGHPEWHDEIIIPFINAYEKEGEMTKEYAEECREQTRKHHDGDKIGRVLLRVLSIV